MFAVRGLKVDCLYMIGIPDQNQVPSAPNTLLGSVFRYPKLIPNPLGEGSSEHKGVVLGHFSWPI